LGRYQYRAMTKGGDVLEQVMEASSRDAVVARIRDLDQWPIEVVEQEDAASASARFATLRAWWRRYGPRERRNSLQDLAVFARQLGALLAARVPLPDALRVIADSAPDQPLAVLARRLHLKVREGASLSDALKDHPGSFDPFFAAMVRAGEGGGALGESMERLGLYLERTAKLRAEIRSALVYPVVLLTAALVSIVVLVTVVVPQFEFLLRGVPGELPWSTRAIFAVSGALRILVPLLLLAGLVAAVVYRKQIQSGEAWRWLERSFLRLPILRRLVVTMELEKVFRSLGALIQNRVGLSESLGLAASVTSRSGVGAAVAESAERVRQGKRLSVALAGHRLMPPLAVQLIRIGEESGDLAAMFLRLADSYAVEVETSLKRAITLIEPSLIIVVGLFVAIIVLSLLSAIVGINAAFS
jgi:general secretion pathway protein F